MLTIELKTIGQTKINTLIPSVLFVVLDFIFLSFFFGLSLYSCQKLKIGIKFNILSKIK